MGSTPRGPTLGRMRIDLHAHSTASDLVITSMPALLMADGTTYGEPLSTQVTMMLITLRYACPGCHCPALACATQRLPTACVT